MNAPSEARLAEVYPELARRVRQGAEMLESLGYTMGVSQALRTWSQQNFLFSKGRDMAGNIVDPQLVVTHARGGESYHNYGLAIDFFFLNVDGSAIWGDTFPGYAKAVEVFESLGLTCGARWHGDRRDPDHAQLTGPYPEDAPDAAIKYIFREGGLSAVYSEMDKALGIQGGT